MTETGVLSAALHLLFSGNGEFWRTVLLSLEVSIGASVVAAIVGAPLGAALAAFRFPGRPAVLVLVNSLLGLPPVVVGLALYLALSRAGAFGFLDLLFTPAAMTLAQIVLTLPIIVALTHRACAQPWADHADALQIDGASRPRVVWMLLAIARLGLLTAFLAAFGRAISEVGAISIVGGNIRGVTRTMTTTIVLETSKGDLALALAIGAVLVSLSTAVSATAFLVAGWTARR